MLQDIKELLKGTFLEDAMMMELEIPRTTDIAIAIDVNSENAIDAWKLLKSYIAQTQRYPVLTECSKGGFETWEEKMIGQDFFSRFYFDDEYEEELSPEEIISKAELYTQDDLEEFLNLQADESTYELEEQIHSAIEDMKARFGIAPLESEIKLVKIRTIIDLERYLLNWELNHSLQPKLDLSYLNWMEHTKGVLILLPNPHGWNVLAYLNGWKTRDSMYVFKQWHQDFGAELVSTDGIIIGFTAVSKPSSIKQAFDLAWQQQALAPDTLFDQGISIRDHARNLLTLDRWFILYNPY